MSKLIIPPLSLKFLSVLYRSDIKDEKTLIHNLKDKWGDHFYFTHPFFPMKSYYAKEMGDECHLNRFFLVFKNLVSRDILKEFKIECDQYENQHMSSNKNRFINLDPGIITLENMYLATGKQFSHRLHLGDGVYLDLNYVFKDNSYHTLDWTYPDYAHPDIILFFNWARAYLKLKSEKMLDKNDSLC